MNQRKISLFFFPLFSVLAIFLLAKPNSTTATSSCEHIEGNGPHKVVFMRGYSTLNNYNSYTQTDGLSDTDFRSLVTGVVNNGFHGIDPFKEYSNPTYDMFSFYVDKTIVSDLTLPENDVLGDEIALIWGSTETQAVINHSSCTDAIFAADDTDYYTSGGLDPSALIPAHTANYMFYVAKPGVHPGWSNLVHNFSVFNLDRHDENYSSQTPWIDMHEFGHAFAKLRDEYIYSKFGSIWNATANGSTENCTGWPYRDYHGPGNLIYGSTSSVGCSYINYDIVTSPKAGPRPYYRPSVNGIMNNDYLGGKFNVISCGYIMAAIIGDLDFNYPWIFQNVTYNLPLTKKRAEKFWPERWYFTGWFMEQPQVSQYPGCSAMDTIRDGRPAVSPSPNITTVNE